MLQLRQAKLDHGVDRITEAYDAPSLSPKPNLAQIHAPCKCETDSVSKTESVSHGTPQRHTHLGGLVRQALTVKQQVSYHGDRQTTRPVHRSSMSRPCLL